MTLQVVPVAGHAKRMSEDKRPVSVVGQVSAAGEKHSADIFLSLI